MKKKFLVCMLILLGLSGVASATTIVDFSTMPNQANYTGNSDFLVTTYGGPETDIILAPHIYSSYLVNSSDPADVSSAYPTEDIIDFDFYIGMDTVIIDMYWAGNPGSSQSSGVTITSFDIDGNLLQQFGYIAGYHAVYNFDSTELIYSIQTNTNLLPSRDSWWYGINSISYDYNASTVPEPTTMFLLGTGLLGLAATRRRIRK